MSSPRPLTAAELVKHPEYPYTTWNLKPASKGRCSVAGNRGGPIHIAYEVHGSGPRKLVLLMGLGGLKTAWQRQTKDFGHAKGEQYSVLIMDNRGVGESDKPVRRYSTSEMAHDVLEVVDHVGWKDKRQLHVAGISMGGMIAQELAFIAPERIASLNLISTAAAVVNTVGWFTNLKNRAMLFIPKSMDAQLAMLKGNMFTESWCNSPDDLASECVKEPFATNGDRIAAAEVAKRADKTNFSFLGFVTQAIAAGWHYKSVAQLQQISHNVGPERIMIVHGSSDQMLTFPHAKALLEGLGGEDSGVTHHFVEGQGHVIPIEMREVFRTWLEANIEKGEALNGVPS